MTELEKLQALAAKIDSAVVVTRAGGGRQGYTVTLGSALADFYRGRNTYVHFRICGEYVDVPDSLRRQVNIAGLRRKTNSEIVTGIIKVLQQRRLLAERYLTELRKSIRSDEGDLRQKQRKLIKQEKLFLKMGLIEEKPEKPEKTEQPAEDGKQKIKPPTEKQYHDSAIQQALGYCPSIKPCKTCGWPVIDGYVCHTCEDQNP